MHRTKAERQSLAQQLLGTPDEPGPLDVGWLKARYGIAGSGIKRWREQGIPEARLDDLVAAIKELAGTEKEPPEWAADMERRLTKAILTKPETVELAKESARYGVEQTLGPQPPAEPAPEKQGPQRERAVRR